MSTSVHQPLGQLDSGHNSRVGSTTANVAFHGAPDLGFGGMGRLAQQARTGHDHARRAIAALHGVGLNERLLQGTELTYRHQALDGGDLFSCNFRRWSDARSGWCAVDKNGAGPALA